MKKLTDATKVDSRNYIDDKNKMLLKSLRIEMENRVSNEVREKLKVPGIVGDDAPFTTLATFLTNFYMKTE